MLTLTFRPNDDQSILGKGAYEVSTEDGLTTLRIEKLNDGQYRAKLLFLDDPETAPTYESVAPTPGGALSGIRTKADRDGLRILIRRWRDI